MKNKNSYEERIVMNSYVNIKRNHAQKRKKRMDCYLCCMNMCFLVSFWIDRMEKRIDSKVDNKENNESNEC